MPRGALALAIPAALMSALGMKLAIAGLATGDPVVRGEIPYVESVEVIRRLVAVQAEPRRLAPRGACARLDIHDLAARVGGTPARVTNLERMPQPSVIWLLLDTSRSVEVVQEVVKRDARRVVRELAEPTGADVALVTIDEDTRLLSAPGDDYERLIKTIDDVPLGGQSFLRDGLAEILGQIAGDRRDHLVIFWTDGDDRFSVRSAGDVESALAAAPHARLVPIVFPALERRAGERLIDIMYFRLARQSGGAVYRCGGDWLERLRESLARRWVVTVEPPSDSEPDAPLEIASTSRQCRFSILEIPDESGVPPGTSPAWEDAWRRQRHREDVAPCGVTEPLAKAWRRPPHGEPGRIDGCALDIVREPGILYREGARGRVETLSSLKIASRPWTIAVPALGDLAHTPEDALDRWARETELPAPRREAEAAEESPRIVHGRTFLTMQGTIGRVLWDTQPEMRAFARRTLETEAKRSIATAAAAIRIADPAIDREQAIAAAQSSSEGRRLRAAAEAPSDGDLRRALAAWLGDIGARELFERWERLLAEDLLAEQLSMSDAESLWTVARAHFALPERARTLTLLVPGRNQASGPVGFWRVILPRAVWIFDRLTTGSEAFPYDHVPERPLALLALDRALKDEPRLDPAGLRVTAVTYEPVAGTWREDPARPFRRGVVRVTLTPENAGDRAARTLIEAAFDTRRDGVPEIVRVTVR